MKEFDTPAEIALNIKHYFGGKGITLTKAAEMLGVSLSAVTNQLSTKRSFGKANALRYAETFGFDAHYLQTGYGSLFVDAATAGQPTPIKTGGVFIPQETLELYTNLSESLRIMSGLVERYAPKDRDVAPIKRGTSPLDYLTK